MPVRDYLTGTSGQLVQATLVVLSLIFSFSAVLLFRTPHAVYGYMYLFLGILFCCAIVGIRHWLRRIVRNRNN